MLTPNLISVGPIQILLVWLVNSLEWKILATSGNNVDHFVKRRNETSSLCAYPWSLCNNYIIIIIKFLILYDDDYAKKWPNYVRDYARKMHWSIFWPQILFLSPPPRSMILFSSPIFHARGWARGRIHINFDPNWLEAPKILDFTFPKVIKWLKLERIKAEVGKKSGKLGK